MTTAQLAAIRDAAASIAGKTEYTGSTTAIRTA